MSKKTKRILLVAAIVLLFALAFFLLNELIFSKAARAGRLPELPGASPSSSFYDPGTLTPGLLKVIQGKLVVQLAVDGEVVEGILVSCYETSPRRGEEGTRTGLYRAADQIMYGRALARMGKRAEFMRWLDHFDRAFRGEGESFHASFLEAGDQGLPLLVSRGEPHWSVTLAYTRTLLEAYRAFGGKNLAALIRQESDGLLPVFAEGETADELTAGPRILLAYDEWDIPPQGVVPEPGEDAPLEQAQGTHLADIDLWALLALSRFDPEWAPIASDWKQILAGARLDSELPLYASAVGQDGVSYLTVTGGSSVSKVKEQLTIGLSLAETGLIDRDLVSYYRSQLRDNKSLPSGWNPVTGGATESAALTADYALALMLGRAAGDNLLIETARDAVMLSYASSQTSDIFGGWYRPGESSRTFRLTAEDNTAVLSAFR